jgi:probable rRNA maturation factor
MILNRQDKTKVDLASAEVLVRQLGRILGLEGKRFNVCFVDDHQIQVLNAAYRHKSSATDVLSFPWKPGSALDIGRSGALSDPSGEFQGFLGDVVISAETAGHNAKAEGHTLATEISWLILHGLLHLIGMDHETDGGEMQALEYDLRERLGLSGSSRPSRLGKKSAPKPRSGRGPTRIPAKREPAHGKGGLQNPGPFGSPRSRPSC